jgi:hypothetical protein
VTTKRRKLIAIVLIAVIGGVIALSLPRRNNEPEYQGRRLSEWLELCVSYQGDELGRHVEPTAAVQKIGTNALPYLLKWIAHEQPTWKSTLYVKLPSFIRNLAPVRSWLVGPLLREALAIEGFTVLGTNAASCVPALEAMMKADTNGVVSAKLSFVLGEIGEAAIPAIKAALANTNQVDRYNVLYAVNKMPRNQATNLWLPIVLGALNDHDGLVRAMATNIMKNFTAEALTNAPLE